MIPRSKCCFKKHFKNYIAWKNCSTPPFHPALQLFWSILKAYSSYMYSNINSAIFFCISTSDTMNWNSTPPCPPMNALTQPQTVNTAILPQTVNQSVPLLTVDSSAPLPSINTSPPSRGYDDTRTSSRWDISTFPPSQWEASSNYVLSVLVKFVIYISVF